MTDLFPMSDLAADDLLLDHLAARRDAGGEPVAVMLGALAAHADTPLPAHTGRRKVGRKHRYIGAFAALAVAASGAGVAAAVTLPSRGLSAADRARIEQKMEQSAHSDAPSGLLTRLGLPQTSGTTEARGLVLYRQPDGTIVLLPASVVAAAEASGGPAVALGGAADGVAQGGGQGGAQGSTAGVTGPNGNAWGATQGGQGGNSDGNANAGSQGGSTPTGTPTDPGNGDGDADQQGAKPAPTPSGPSSGNQGGNGNVGKGVDKGKNVTPTPTPTGTPSADLYSTATPPTGRLNGGPSPRSTTPVRAPKPVGAPGTADPVTTGAGTADTGSTGAAALDPGTDASTNVG
ncbi:hypothetical protein GCM10027053_34350 [Intrasporangium mesophilum]